jgi:hypothetical protein
LLTSKSGLYASEVKKLNAVVKEDVAAFSAAYVAYKLDNTVSTSLRAIDLMPYFNYVKQDTTSALDSNASGYNESCAALTPCLQMHNGSIILFSKWQFGTNGPLNQRVIEMLVDPDGRVTGNNDSIWFELFYNGRLTSEDKADNYYHELGGPYSPGSVPYWFSW